MGRALDMREIKVDLPAFGYPTNPTSARSFSSRTNDFSSPASPGSQYLGMVRWKDSDFVVADIPGIIEGAHTGTGLGLRFLRHIERTRIILYLIDLSPDNLRDPKHELEVLINELGSYSPSLLERKQIVVFNKCDLTGAVNRAKEAIAFAQFKGYPFFVASGLTGLGMEDILDEIVKELHEHKNEGITPKM